MSMLLARSRLLLFVIACTWLATGCATARTRNSHTGSAAHVTGEALLRAAIEIEQRGDATRAEQYALMAVERGASRQAALPLLLRVCVRSARLSAALAHALSFLRAHPEDNDLRYVVATLHAALGRHDAARSDALRVIRARPQDMAARRLLAELMETSP